MAERSKKPTAGTGEIAHDGAQRFQSLVIPVDLTPLSDRVLGRAARLPLAPDARITLLHVVPKNLPRSAQQGAQRDAKRAIAEEARELGRSLPRGVEIETVVKVGTAPAEIAACATARKAELIVMGRGGSRALRDAFLGSTAERVIRRGQLPVLTVRLAPRAAYGRPAVAIDLEHGSLDALVLMLRVLPHPRPPVAVIHAFDTPYRGVVYPSLSEDEAEAFRSELALKATRKLAKLLTASLAQADVPPLAAPHWRTHVQCGSTRLVIERAIKRGDNDLLVLGTHGYSGVAHVFLGSVAGDVLREVACDVLVVPSPQPAE